MIGGLSAALSRVFKHKLDCTQHETGQLEDAIATQAKQEVEMDAEPAKAALSAGGLASYGNSHQTVNH
ncbi:TPA: hypothetical protein ACH3X1_001959 [Trebouxia sp. C0004]